MSPYFGWLFLIAVVAALAAASAYRRRASETPASPLREPEDPTSLGLSPTRPATARPKEDSEDKAPVEQADAKPLPSFPMPSAAGSTETHAVPRENTRPEPGPYAASDSPLWPEGHQAAAMLVGSLAAHLGGTVAVLRANGSAYTVDALSASPPATPEPLAAATLDAVEPDGSLTELNTAARAALRYHDDPALSVGQAVACVLGEPPAARVLLVADLPPGAPEIDTHSADVILRYASLLARVSDLGVEPMTAPDDSDPDDIHSDEPVAALDEATHLPEPDTDEDAPLDVQDATPEPSDNDRPDDEPVPRLQILADEMYAAREADQPLSFGLMTLAAAEDLLEHDETTIAEAAADLAERLRGWPNVRRVEPFGDLVFGVFLDGPLDDDTREQLLTLAARPPQMMAGMVQVTGTDPEPIRSVAFEALHGAYEQRRPIVFAALDDQ